MDVTLLVKSLDSGQFQEQEIHGAIVQSCEIRLGTFSKSRWLRMSPKLGVFAKNDRAAYLGADAIELMLILRFFSCAQG